MNQGNAIALLGRMAKIVEVGPSADTGPNQAPSDPNEANTAKIHSPYIIDMMTGY